MTRRKTLAGCLVSGCLSPIASFGGFAIGLLILIYEEDIRTLLRPYSDGVIADVFLPNLIWFALSAVFLAVIALLILPLTPFAIAAGWDILKYLNRTAVTVDVEPATQDLDHGLAITNREGEALTECRILIEDVILYPLLLVNRQMPMNLCARPVLRTSQMQWRVHSDPGHVGEIMIAGNGGQAEMLVTGFTPDLEGFVPIMTFPDPILVGPGIVTFQLRLVGRYDERAFSQVIFKGYFTYSVHQNGSTISPISEGSIPRRVIEEIQELELPVQEVSQITLAPRTTNASNE